MRSARRAKLRSPALVLVAIPVLLNFVLLRAQTSAVQNSNDGAFHLAVIRQARELWSAGSLPFDGWLAALSTGFPVLHHYQTLPHVISGLMAVVFGAPRTYSWSLYLLLGSWPIAVYIGGRLMGWDRWQAGTAAFLSPLIVAVTGMTIEGRPAGTYGYEYRSYTWGGGAGVWSQLWGMWLLPLSWGLTWRAVSRKGSASLASLVSALTLACHFITGYLALASIGAWVVVKPSEFVQRLRRGLVVLAGSLLTAAWVVVPILQDTEWASRTEYLVGWWTDSYGAPRVLGWLATGDLFDYQRFPLITLLGAVGIVVCVKQWTRSERARGLIAVFGLSLIALMGRGLVGPLLWFVPGGDEILLARLLIGVHLGGIYFAGIGSVAAARFVREQFRTRRGPKRFRLEFHGGPRPIILPVGLLAAAIVGVVGPPLVSGAWAGWARYADAESVLIEAQQAVDRRDGAAFKRLVEYAQRRGEGRMYAGTCAITTPLTHCFSEAPSREIARGHAEDIRARTWGARYRILAVPGYMALSNAGAEVIGYPFRTASIVTDVEARFDDARPAHYDLFNVRYLLLPAGRRPPVPAQFLRGDGRHRLWEVETGGYIKVIDVRGSLTATRRSFGKTMERFLDSSDLSKGIHPSVSLEGHPAHAPTLARGAEASQPPGSVDRERSKPSGGSFSATVTLRRRAAVMLKSSFHPRWRATVDNRLHRAYLVAPGYPAVTVGPGTHTISFRYEPYPRYHWLFVIGFLTLLGLWALRRRGRHRETT